jgi:hypothetical protein
MTRRHADPARAGTVLLKLARVLFNDHVLDAVVLPTIADLQREIDEAGGSLLRRLHARWRGYWAFWTAALLAPAALPAAPSGESGGVGFPDAIARLAVVSIGVVVLAIIGPVLGGWMALATAGGAVFAIAIHRWHDRHPSHVPAPSDPDGRTPQINFSSTGVAANTGGLIFVVGSLFIVAVGLPSLVWFLCAGLVGGTLLAWALVAWHQRHPKRGLPEDLIVLR